MGKKQLLINLISNIMSFALQMGISFILTPIIVEKVGDAAYGFIGLANNFVSYANIFSIIINSMASRFITMELAREDVEKANKYYSSVFVLDIIISTLVAIVSIFIIYNLNSLLDIPSVLEDDVKVTFALSFANFIISIISTVFSVAAFAKNRLDVSATKTIVGNIIKSVFLICLFTLLSPKIYYISLASVVVSAYMLVANLRVTTKLAPELKLKLKFFDKKCIKELTGSGIWNALNNLGKTLLTGLDLLIANIFMGANEMGILAIAKTVPASFEGLLATISNIFMPQFIMQYSKNKIQELVHSVNFSMKLIGLIMIVPLSGFIAFGTEFFALWLPSKTVAEINQLQILSILSLLPYIVSANNFTLFALDTTTNKLKRPVIVTIVISVLSTVTTFILLKTTDLGIYAIAGASSIYWALKVFFFNTINAAINLNLKWNTFYNQYLKNIGCFILVLLLFTIIDNYLVINTWITFIITVAIVGALGYLCTFMILMNREEKKRIYELVKNKFLNVCNKGKV